MPDYFENNLSPSLMPFGRTVSRFKALQTLKTVTSLNKESRRLISLAIVVCGDTELKCSTCYNRKAQPLKSPSGPWVNSTPNAISRVDKRVVFQKGGFGGCSPGTKTGTRVHSDVPPERRPE